MFVSLFCGNQTIFGWEKLNICPWKFKVQIMAKLNFEAQHSIDIHVFVFPFLATWAMGSFLAETNQILILKIQGQGHSENRPKSNQVIFRSGPSILPKMKQIWTRQIWGIWKLRPAYSPEMPNLGQNLWCFVPCRARARHFESGVLDANGTHCKHNY